MIVLFFLGWTQGIEAAPFSKLAFLTQHIGKPHPYLCTSMCICGDALPG
jgi:hypothetical protein